MGLFNKHSDDKKADKRMAKAAFGMRDQMLQQAASLQGNVQGAMAALQHMDMGEMTAYAEKAKRITANGVDGTATIVSARNLGPGATGVSAKMEFELAVTSGPGSPRNISVTQEMMGDLAGYAPGAEIPLRINSADPDEALIWGSAPETASAGAVTAPAGDDTLGRLEELAKLRDSGALSSEEFDQQKARILAES
jgi:hypothetical protein